MRKIFTFFAVALLASSVWAAPKKTSNLCFKPAPSPIVAPQTELRLDESQMVVVEDGVKQCVESTPVFKQVKATGKTSEILSQEFRSHGATSAFESVVVPVSQVSMIPTMQQAELQMRYAKALASQEAYTLPASFVGQGNLLTSMDKTLGSEWTTLALVLNDTAYFKQLVPFMTNQAPIVYGLVQADGTIALPNQKIAETAEYSISFSGLTVVNEAIVALDTTAMLFQTPYLLANAPAMAYTMSAVGAEDNSSYVSLYTQCMWTDAAYDPNADADIVYTAQGYSGYEEATTTWTAALTYGESDKFTNGEAVTLSNPLFADKTINYTCEGVYNDGYITIAKQPVYQFEDGSYLWLTGIDNNGFVNLSFKVEQDGHLLVSANEAAALVATEAADELDAESDLDLYDTFTGLSLYDGEANLFENKMPELAFGYGESNFNGTKEWEFKSYFNVATGELTFFDLFPVNDFEGWSAKAVYDAATKTLTVPCGQVVEVSEQKDGSPEYIILGGLDESGNAFVSKVEFKMDADGNFVTSGWIGLASCVDAELNDNTFDGFYELFKPGVVLSEARIERGPQTVAGTDNFILNWSLRKDLKFTGLHAGMMAANADITFCNYTPADSYNSLSWSMAMIDFDDDDNIVPLAEYSSEGETLKVRTSPALYSYPTLTATNDAGSTANVLNAMEGFDEYGIVAGASSSYYTVKDVEPFLMRATFDQNFTTASGVAPGSTPAKNNKISNAYFYQGNPGAPFCFDGIDIVCSKFSVTNESAVLTCRIRACERTYNHAKASTKLDVKDTLYTAKVLVKDAFTDLSDGLGYLHIDGFYQEIEGMQMQVEFMQVNQEFLVELAWDDNESFTFTPFSDSHVNDVAAARNTYFSTSDPEEAGKYFYWTSTAQNNVAVSFCNALFGYLDMEGSHVFELPAEGGSVDIVVKPFYCDYDQAEQPITSLWLAEDSEPVTLMWEDEEFREESWVKAEIVEEHYGEGEEFSFTLRLTADALQAGAPGRNLPIAFEQWGARPELEVLQGEGAVSGISQIRMKKVPGQLYKVNGQKANAASKGILVGRQFKAVVR